MTSRTAGRDVNDASMQASKACVCVAARSLSPGPACAHRLLRSLLADRSAGNADLITACGSDEKAI
jgi:hypothetical protein